MQEQLYKWQYFILFIYLCFTILSPELGNLALYCSFPPLQPLYFYAVINIRKMNPLLSFITKQHEILINKMCAIPLHREMINLC